MLRADLTMDCRIDMYVVDMNRYVILSHADESIRREKTNLLHMRVCDSLQSRHVSDNRGRNRIIMSIGFGIYTYAN
jgi:hypothetical protein